MDEYLYSVRFRLDFDYVPGTQGINKSWVQYEFNWVPESLVSQPIIFFAMLKLKEVS